MSRVRLPEIPWAWAWGAIVLAFPWSNAFMSIATGWLGLVTLTQLQSRSISASKTASNIALRRAGWALILLVLWSGLSVIWGGEAETCLHDVRVKLPLAIGGWAMVTMSRQSRAVDLHQLKPVVKVAVLSAALATVSLIVWDLSNGGPNGGRQSSQFISHIRFGLWWAFLLPWSGYLLGNRWMWGCLIGAVSAWTWTQGVTGLLVGIAMAPWWIPWLGTMPREGAAHRAVWPTAKALRRNFALMAAVLIPILILLTRALPTAMPQADQLPSHTDSGEPYVHKLNRSVTEHGHFVWTHLAWGELRKAWEGRSDIPFGDIEGALVRFLSSKGLPKDTEGVAALSEEEVQAIGRRVTSTVELEGGAWQKRWNRFKFEWGQWLDGTLSPDASVLARTVYLDVAFDAWRALPLLNKAIGAGSGRVGAEMEQGFIRSFPQWPPKGRKRPHNQYMTLALALGAIGLGLLLWAMASMWAHAPCRPGVLLLALSCLTEDTLETQAGVTLAVVALVFGTLVKSRERVK